MNAMGPMSHMELGFPYAPFPVLPWYFGCMAQPTSAYGLYGPDKQEQSTDENRSESHRDRSHSIDPSEFAVPIRAHSTSSPTPQALPRVARQPLPLICEQQQETGSYGVFVQWLGFDRTSCSCPKRSRSIEEDSMQEERLRQRARRSSPALSFAPASAPAASVPSNTFHEHDRSTSPVPSIGTGSNVTPSPVRFRNTVLIYEPTGSAVRRRMRVVPGSPDGSQHNSPVAASSIAPADANDSEGVELSFVERIVIVRVSVRLWLALNVRLAGAVPHNSARLTVALRIVHVRMPAAVVGSTARRYIPHVLYSEHSSGSSTPEHHAGWSASLSSIHSPGSTPASEGTDDSRMSYEYSLSVLLQRYEAGLSLGPFSRPGSRSSQDGPLRSIRPRSEPSATSNSASDLARSLFSSESGGDPNLPPPARDGSDRSWSNEGGDPNSPPVAREPHRLRSAIAGTDCGTALAYASYAPSAPALS